MWSEYIIPASLQETLQILKEKRPHVRIVAGATDLMLEFERGLRKDVHTLIDINRLPDLNYIRRSKDDRVHIGPLVTHNAVAASALLRKHAMALVSAAWQVGAPQIRNRGTVAGNLITASPANDTITPLLALGASVTLTSLRGTREVPLEQFYTGVRRTVLEPDEMLVDISFPVPEKNWHSTFLKLGLRRAQAISLVNTAIVLDIDMEDRRVRSAIITLGAVAPTIVRAREAEQYLAGMELTDESIERCGELAAGSAHPIDDIRGSAAYRSAMVKTLVKRGLRQLHAGQETFQVPASPVLLQGKARKKTSIDQTNHGAPIHIRINGKEHIFPHGHGKSLLRLLREDAGLTGTKEGCAEGECGACTVYLDGIAVMACLVPAAGAHGCSVTTIEGLSAAKSNRTSKARTGQKKPALHPVQDAFITAGAVQCGYCTPGFIMSAAKLLEEKPSPTREEITQALTGNLCRCTGYYKIVQAVEEAARK